MEDTITWVTLRSYSTPIEAHVVRGHLESEGIPCFLRDEHTIDMNWLYSNVLGGVKLCVPEQELHHAREILAGKTDDGKPAGLSCPDCGSDRLQDLGRRRNWAIFSLLAFNLPLPFAKKRYRCEACGHAFRMGS
jgi:DNA-directed RNA polymerase subunit RPC12/RpoP